MLGSSTWVSCWACSFSSMEGILQCPCWQKHLFNMNLKFVSTWIWDFGKTKTWIQSMPSIFALILRSQMLVNYRRAKARLDYLSYYMAILPKSTNKFTWSFLLDIPFANIQGHDLNHDLQESLLFHLLVESSTWVPHCRESLELSFELASSALHPSSIPVEYLLSHTCQWYGSLCQHIRCILYGWNLEIRLAVLSNL